MILVEGYLSHGRKLPKENRMHHHNIKTLAMFSSVFRGLYLYYAPEHNMSYLRGGHLGKWNALRRFLQKKQAVLFFKISVIIFFTFTHDTCWNHVNFASVFMLGNGLKVGELILHSVTPLKWGSSKSKHPLVLPCIGGYFWNSSLLQHYPTCKNLLGFFSVLIGSLTKGKKPTCFSKCVVPVEVGISFFENRLLTLFYVVSHNT